MAVCNSELTKKNTFKFVKVSERLAKLHADYIRKPSPRVGTDFSDEQHSNFYETLLRWSELDYSADFEAFKKSIAQCQYQTLAQLVYWQKKLVDVMIEYLQDSTSVCLPALLELCSAIAQDLLGDFYAHFPQVFRIMVERILSTNEPEKLELYFSCLTQLIYLQWRHMLPDVVLWFGHFTSLLLNGRQHIRRFACESFSYLVRKVPDFSNFMNHCVIKTCDQPKLLDGVAQLVFESLRGVQRRLHSAAPRIFEALFSLVKQRNSVVNYHNTLSKVLTAVTERLAKHCDKDSGWHTCKLYLDAFHAAMACKDVDHCVLQTFLSLLHVWATYKHGHHIVQPQIFLESITQHIVVMHDFPADVFVLLLNMLSVFLTAKESDLNSVMVMQAVEGICERCSANQLVEFLKQICPLRCFSNLLLPIFVSALEGCARTSNSENMDLVLVSLVVAVNHACSCAAENHTDMAIDKHDIDFSKFLPGASPSSCYIMQGLSTVINCCATSLSTNVTDAIDATDWLRLTASLTVYPHFGSWATTDQLRDCVTMLFSWLMSKTFAQEDVEIRMLANLALYRGAVALFTRTSNFSASFSWLVWEDLLSFTKKFALDENALLFMDLYLGMCKQEDVSHEKWFSAVYSAIATNLSSPYHKIRLHTLEILCRFPANLALEAPNDGPTSVFEICLRAEKLSPTIGEYREKLRLLRKLSYAEMKHSLPDSHGDTFELAALRYLVGNLYVNFSPMWKELCQLIETQARGLPANTFWPYFTEVLHGAAANVKNGAAMAEERMVLNFLEQHGNTNTAADHLYDAINVSRGDVQKCLPDCYQFRVLLWKALELFADLVEPKSRQVSPVLLDFIREEYYHVDVMSAPSQNLHRDVDKSVDVTVADSESRKVRRKALTKTLLAHLAVFAKFKNPKAMFMEPKVMSAYEEFIVSSNDAVQKAAVKCLFAYNFKWLNPYKESLNRLLDEKTFTSELVLFSVDDTDSGVVAAEHREQLMPLLMRFLYGKLSAATGLNATQAKVRKSQIFRFLANCDVKDLVQFVNLAFAPLQPLLKTSIGGSLCSLCDLQAVLDLKACIPLRRLQGILDSMGLIMKNLGYRLLSEGHRIFEALVLCCSVIRTLQDQKSIIHERFYSTLRMLRQAVVMRVADFFTSFENYSFSEDELNALFLTLIWPQMTKFAVEGAYSSRGLLRLFTTWSDNPRFFELFAYADLAKGRGTVLDSLFTLLNNANATSAVQQSIMRMCYNLVTLADYELRDDQDGAPIHLSSTVDSLQSIGMDVDGAEMTNLGTRLLSQHTSRIVAYLRGKLDKAAQGKRKRRDLVLTEQELTVLSRLSPFVNDEEQAYSLVGLLLMCFMNNAILNAEIQTSILETVTRLIACCSKAQVVELLRSFARLLSIIDDRLARSALSSALLAVVQKCSSLSRCVNLVVQLNSWHPKRVQEPNFDMRLHAHTELNAWLSNASEPLDFDSSLFLMHNLMWTITTMEDTSLRDNAGHSMVKLVQRLACDKPPVTAEELQRLVNDHLWPLLKRGFRAQHEFVRHECMTLLRALTVTFNDWPRFAGLAALLSNDPDEDVFENLKHIQMHRRARVLRRLSDGLSTVVSEKRLKLGADVLLDVFIRFSAPFILDPTYGKQTSLVDEAVRFLGAACGQLTWHKYLPILRFYLTKLLKETERQKVIVKALAAVLDGFHFELVEPDKLPIGSSDDAMGDADNGVCAMDTCTSATADETPPVTNKTKTAKKGRMKGVREVVISELLPQLRECLTAKKQLDDRHKVNIRGTFYAEDEEILRVPVALAMVKLLRKLPQSMLEQYVPGILLKMFQMLRSRAQEIRESTRTTLVAVMRTLGPRYLSYMVKEMRSVLTRGYQVHVMMFTLHVVINSMLDALQPGDLDACVSDLIELCKEELVGAVADEKEVEEIRRHLMEARSNKARETYRIVGSLATEYSLRSALASLREILNTQYSHKVVRVTSDVCRHLATGLAQNAALGERALFILVHEILSGNMPALFSDMSVNLNVDMEKQPVEHGTLILPPNPGRVGAVTKPARRTNMHVLVEFALQLLLSVLKNCTLTEEHVSMLDPYVSLMLRGIQSKYPKVVTLCLRAFSVFLRCELPSFNAENSEQLIQQLFVLLHHYGGSGVGAKGENLELIFSAFRTLGVALRELPQQTLTDKQLEVLLHYIEADLYDPNRQATAFSLLRVMLTRRFESKELHSVMAKVRELVVTAASEQVRSQARMAYLQYLLDYPLGKRLRWHVEFLVTQLAYEHEDGRVSVLEMLTALITNCQRRILLEYANIVYFHLAMQLVNDDSAKCRRCVGLTTKLLLQNLPAEKQDSLLTMTLEWLAGGNTEKLSHRRMAAQLLGLFVELGASVNFARHVPIVLNAIRSAFVDALAADENSAQGLEGSSADHFLYQLEHCLLNLLKHHASAFNDCAVQLKEIWDMVVDKLLLYPHTWVRLGASQLVGLVLSRYQPSQVAVMSTSGDYFFSDRQSEVERLCQRFLQQLKAPKLNDDLAEQLLRNLVFLGSVLRHDAAVVQPDGVGLFSLTTLASKLMRICRMEVAHDAKNIEKRSIIFKWIGALFVEDGGAESVKCLVPVVLPALHRELTVQATDERLKLVAMEVSEILKQTVGLEYYSTCLRVCQTDMAERREARKRMKATEAVLEPEKAARRKVKRQRAKTESRKKQHRDPLKKRKVDEKMLLD